MSGHSDGGAQNQRVHAMYTRWNSLRMQLGPSASMNEEFVALSRTLQQIASNQRSASQGQPQYGGNTFQHSGAGGMSPPLGTQSMGPGQMSPPQMGGPGGHINPQMNYTGPQANPMPPPHMAGQMGNRMQTPINGQMSSQMGRQMSQMSNQMRSSMSPHMPQRMNAQQPQPQHMNSQQMNAQQMGAPMGQQMNSSMTPPLGSQMNQLNNQMVGGGPQMAPPVNVHQGGYMPGNNHMGRQVRGGPQLAGQLNQQQMDMRMNMPQSAAGAQMDANQVRMTPVSGPQMPSGMRGAPPGFGQQQQQRRPESRAQEAKRKPSMSQQQQQQLAQRQAQAQQRAQLAHMPQQRAQQQHGPPGQPQPAQRAQGQPQGQPPVHTQENNKKDEDSQGTGKDGWKWLNLDDIGGDLGEIGGDLDIDNPGDLFGDAEGSGPDSFFYSNLYPQPNESEDNGFMDVLNDINGESGMKLPGQPSIMGGQPRMSQQPPQPQPQPPQAPPSSGSQGLPQDDTDAGSMISQRQAVSRPMSSQANVSKPSSHTGPVATPRVSSTASPAAAASPQIIARKASVEHTGSLLQHSPALSQQSLPRVTPQATPVIPSRTAPTPSAPAPGAAPNMAQAQGPHMPGNDVNSSDLEGRKADQLLTPEEVLILNNQDFAFKALQNNQSIPDSVRHILFNMKGPTQRLPQLSHFRAQSRAVSNDLSSAVNTPRSSNDLSSIPFTKSQQVHNQLMQQQMQSQRLYKMQQAPQAGQRAGQRPTANIPNAGPKLNGAIASESEAISPRDSTRRSNAAVGEPQLSHFNESGNMGRPQEDHGERSSDQEKRSSQQQQQDQQLQRQSLPEQQSISKDQSSSYGKPASLQDPSSNLSIYDRELPAQLAQQVPHAVPQPIPQPELKKQHLEQHHMDRELSLKQLKQQQWQAQQRQEEMFRQRYTTGDTDDVAFIVAGGKNLNTSSRSRRLTSSSEASNESSPDLDMLTQLGFDRIVNPLSLIPKAIKFEDLEKHDELLTIPSLFPIGVSGQQMKFERSRHIREKIIERIATLESKPHLEVDEEIELRQLRLQPFLKAVRGDLLSHIQYFSSVAIDRSNRVHFARMKLLTQHDAALVERFVNEQALERRRSENMTQHLHLQRVHRHESELREFEAKRKNQRALLGSKIVGFHQLIEREERKRYERTAKQRLQLLRANDEEAYLKLIDQTKDARITHLLKQTNKFLAGLAKAVKDQQGEEMGEIDLESEDVREKIDYYEVAHRVKEKVTEQPSMLVGGKLKEYQLKGLQWMVSLYNNNLNGILADEMGLGKTIQSISLIAYLIEVKKIKGPFLVLVPLSTLTNWNMEFDLWAPSVQKIVYRGPPASRKALQPQIRSGEFQVLLTTYEYVIKERPLFSRIKWEHMIIDEGHRMKNTQSKLSSTLAQYYTSRYRLILTGTPLQNNLPELWALLNFVLPKIFNSVKSFEEWFNKPFAQAGSSDRMDLGEEEKLLIIRRLHKVLRPFLLRRLKKDVEQDLPDKVEKVIKCRKSALQSQLYRQLLDHNAFALGASQGGIRALSNRVMQLRKLCNHPFVFEEVEKVVNPGGQNNDLLWRVSGKLELLDRVLPKFKATGHRTLMFFQMTQIMDIMEDFLRLRGIQYLRLDGTTKAETRSELLRLFNEPNSPYFCFLLSTRAGGLGLNLQTADTVIIYDTDWNPHQDLQAQDRAHRIGQTKEVRILRLITENSIEENILERAQGKLDIDGKVIQAGKFDNKSTNEEQEAFLRTLLEAEESKNEGKEDELDELDDEELNSMLARTEDERQLFHDMDRQRIASEGGRGKPRLFSEAELPEQYTTAHIDQQLSEASAREISNIDEGGHHLRARRSGNWADVEEILPPRKRSKMLDESPSPGLPTAAVQASAPPALPKPRTGRKGRPPRVKETMTPEAREQLTDVGRRIVKRMKAVVDDDGRKRIDLFLELPSRSHYPDYYQVIGVPMCVATIVKRINSKYYQSFEQLSNDWRIIFRNARWYNAEGSIIYNDANALEEAYETMYRQLTGVEPPSYVDVVGDQPEKLNLQRGLPTPGTVDMAASGGVVPKREETSATAVTAGGSSSFENSQSISSNDFVPTPHGDEASLAPIPNLE